MRSVCSSSRSPSVERCNWSGTCSSIMSFSLVFFLYLGCGIWRCTLISCQLSSFLWMLWAPSSTVIWLQESQGEDQSVSAEQMKGKRPMCTPPLPPLPVPTKWRPFPIRPQGKSNGWFIWDMGYFFPVGCMGLSHHDTEVGRGRGLSGSGQQGMASEPVSSKTIGTIHSIFPTAMEPAHPYYSPGLLSSQHPGAYHTSDQVAPLLLEETERYLLHSLHPTSGSYRCNLGSIFHQSQWARAQLVYIGHD